MQIYQDDFLSYISILKLQLFVLQLWHDYNWLTGMINLTAGLWSPVNDSCWHCRLFVNMADCNKPDSDSSDPWW